jgi:RNA polymerase sigma-B factor
LQELTVRVGRETAALSAELGRAPTLGEIAARVEGTVEQVLEARQTATARHALSLDAPRPIGDEPDELGRDVPVDEVGFEAAEDSVVLRSLLATLPERDRLVLQLRFQEDLTQTQISLRVGLSQMQVSRLIHSAFDRLERNAAELGVRGMDCLADGKSG